MILKPVIPSPTLAQIEELRAAFFKKLEKDGAPCEGGFHPKDIERIKTTNIWLQRFLEQQDLSLKASLDMLWETCEWRKEYGTNEIDVDNINMDYVNEGLAFPHNRDRDGKLLFIFKSRLHIRGMRDSKELIRIFVYWMERMYREENLDLVSIFFDLADTGLSNMDLDYTKQVVNILKYYYPNALNYIFVYELPWILTAAFKIIKALMPPKAVGYMRFVNIKTVSDYIPVENLLTCWGGKDDYEFKFEPEKQRKQMNGINGHHTNNAIQSNVIDGNEIESAIAECNGVYHKKVHFANISPTESPMSELHLPNNKNYNEHGLATMLKITPAEVITFSKVGDELIGTVDILNVHTNTITYKIKTTSPEKFRVRPSTGILAPGAGTTINVLLQHGQHMTLVMNKDKFLVMCMELKASSNLNTQEIAEIWKTTQSNSASVEQHRLKCTIVSSNNNSLSISSDNSKNGGLYSTNASGYIDSDRQWAHVSSSLSQIVESTHKLESQVKFNQTLQWITVFVFLLLAVAIVYILKIEINHNTEHCYKPHGNRYH